MTFQEIYIQQKEANGGRKPSSWLLRIAHASCCTVDAVYQWATGWRNPSKAAAELTSRELGIPADELFRNLKQDKQ